jgi:hypothetical protein
MTVNERLVSAGLIELWDAAVARRDRAELIRILQQIDVADPAATVDPVLADPARYGFGR